MIMLGAQIRAGARGCFWGKAALLMAVAVAAAAGTWLPAWAQQAQQQAVPSPLIYQPGQLAPTDSTLAVAVGDKAPDFDLPGVDGKRVKLSSYRGVKNVVLSFIPAAWTPVCSGQWPGYHLARSVFEARDAQLIGISCDPIPSLNAWIASMGGLWFPVASDFWPHGAVAAQWGVLRSTGVAERAVCIIDKAGIIRFIDVHDINSRPDLGVIAAELSKLQ